VITLLRRLLCVGLVLCSAGCVARNRLNASCQWIGDDVYTLNLQDHGDDRHLVDDVMLAEELAIRAADVRRGHRSGRFDGDTTYAAARETCLDTVFDAIAADHRVPLTEVRGRLGRRVLSVDLLITGLFAAFYAAAVLVITRHLAIGYSRERPLGSLAATLAASIAASTIGVVAGELWSLLAEGYRVHSNNHMSYRAARIPWTHHRPALFVAGLLLFWIVALRPHRRAD
jgi:hypothetical protein